VISLLGVLAVGPGTAAARATATASIHLKAPSSISASTFFRVTASGNAPSKGKQFVFVMFTHKSTCAATLFKAESRGDVFLPFSGKDGVQVPHGAYSVKTDKVRGGSKATGTLCGYLYAGTQTTNSKPEAHTARAIKFTRPVGPRSDGSGKVLVKR
jgi:hypothetical protein